MKIFSHLNSYKIIAIGVAIIFVWTDLYVIYAPVKFGDKELIEIIVPSGQGVYGIAGTLKNSRLIRGQNIFVLYVHLTGNEKNLKAGRYLMSKSLNIPQITEILSKGLSMSEDVIVTIPEGSNIWDIEGILNAEKLITRGEFARQFYKEEGYLFPDTYRLKNPKSETLNPKSITDDLRVKMADNFKNKIEELFKHLNKEQQAETIIIASILEKEAKTEGDMKLISGIIKKRLAKEMPLEVDASVIYGACLRNYLLKPAAFKGCNWNLISVASEIKIDSPYNTYKRKGLPAGAISNPGLMAVKAALEPTASDYLYYLSTRDGSQIIYAKTPAEQAKNRRKYLGI